MVIHLRVSVLAVGLALLALVLASGVQAGDDAPASEPLCVKNVGCIEPCDHVCVRDPHDLLCELLPPDDPCACPADDP